MFAKGPMPGNSFKTDVLKQIPTAICRKKYSICDLVGYIIYPTKKDADNNTNGMSVGGNSQKAWEQADGYIADNPKKYKKWMVRLDNLEKSKENK